MQQIKEAVERVPYAIGRHMVNVPFRFRLGREYETQKRFINKFDAFSDDEKHDWVASKLERICRDLSECNLWTDRIPSAEDSGNFWSQWKGIPVVTKKQLRHLEVCQRIQRNAFRCNTGGTSGEPFAFYLDRNVFAREWAHMHAIWSRLGYQPSNVKLTFRGKCLGREPIRYNAVHNEFMLNQQVGIEEQSAGILDLPARIEFFHGYPSAIYEFTRKAISQSPAVIDHLRTSLKGILFASEFPAPIYRDLIEDTFQVPTISWYGHSEFCVLAYEVEPYRYKPMQTYGHTEAVPNGDGSFKLVGSSYYNHVFPFIRYDTGDLIEPEMNGELLETFRIKEGRIGDFVTDRDGNRISLTALIFGRHHRIFEVARFVQVEQEKPGEVLFLVTMPETDARNEQQILAEFDLTNIQMSFSVERRNEPVRTPRGKVALLVSRL